MARNVLGGELESCGTDPMTGFHRDGCCNTDAEDAGVHTVCAVVTAEFPRFSTVGNDLVTPRPEFGFPGCDQAIAGVCAGGQRYEERAPRSRRRPRTATPRPSWPR